MLKAVFGSKIKRLLKLSNTKVEVIMKMNLLWECKIDQSDLEEVRTGEIVAVVKDNVPTQKTKLLVIENAEV